MKFISIVALIILFAFPGLGAYYLYHNQAQWRFKTTNKGTLVKPAVLLSSLKHEDKWRLLLWQPDGCDAKCIQQVDKLARIRLALGRRLYSVSVGVLQGSAAKKKIDTTVLTKWQVEAISLATLSVNDTEKVAKLATHSQVLLINPTKYLILTYATSPLDSSGIFYDLKHLLTAGEMT